MADNSKQPRSMTYVHPEHKMSLLGSQLLKDENNGGNNFHTAAFAHADSPMKRGRKLSND